MSASVINIPATESNIKLKLVDSYNFGATLETFDLTTGDNIIPINVSDLSSGLYTIVLEIDDNIVASEHLIVIH